MLRKHCAIASLFGARRGLKHPSGARHTARRIIASLFGARRGLKLMGSVLAGGGFGIASLFGARRGLKLESAAVGGLVGYRLALRSEARIETSVETKAIT